MKIIPRPAPSSQIASLPTVIDATQWIESFNNNNNTGNKYEKITGLSILASANLDNNNNNNNNLLPHNLKLFGCFSTCIGVNNLTQKDTEGGTADIRVLYSDRRSELFSVTEYTKSKEPKKCICNPTPKKIYGIDPKDPFYINLNIEAFNDAIDFRKNNYSTLPSLKWKRISNDPIASDFCSQLAQVGANNWNSLPLEKKIHNLQKILDLNSDNSPKTNGIIYASEQCIEKIYMWSLRDDFQLPENTTAIADGIYIYHYKTGTNYKDTWFIKTQVKFNNGIIEGIPSKKPISEWKPKPGSPYSSWNCTAMISRIFNITEIN